MSKKKGKTPQPAAKKMTANAPKMEAFTFGEPVPVLDRRDILDSGARCQKIYLKMNANLCT